MLVAVAAAAIQPQVVATIDPAHRLVEGVASDGHTIWASSVLDRTIVACRQRCENLAQLADGLYPLGIAWDQGRRWIWVAADCPDLPGIAKCERGALVAIDRFGKELRRIAPFIGEFHPGDVSVSGSQVFVSDSRNGMVFRLTANERGMMAVVLPDVGKSAQGTALDESGQSLVVADYSQGIGVTGIATFQRRLLPRKDGKPLRGIDGLVRCGGTYYAIYNGGAPARLVSFSIAGDHIEFSEPLAAFRPADPTQVAFDGKRLLIVADAGWEPAARDASARSQGASIVAIPLGSDCKPKQR
jgi:hypothetical protein